MVLNHIEFLKQPSFCSPGSKRDPGFRRRALGGDRRALLELHHLLRQGRHQQDHHQGPGDPTDPEDPARPQLREHPEAVVGSPERNLRRPRRGVRHPARGSGRSGPISHQLQERENR